MVNNEELLSKINKFSHAYLINSNNLDASFSFAKDLSKKIIISTNDKLLYKNEEISNLIDENSFDDFFVLNPDNLNIKVDELNELLDYFETKSLRNNGNRVYVIYGIERLRPVFANKLLKFIEEPQDNIFGIILTQNMDGVLPTIISRCQTINLKYDVNIDLDKISDMKKFLEFFIHNKVDTIAYTNDFFLKYEGNRKEFIDCFSAIETIISNQINKYYGNSFNEEYLVSSLDEININKLIKMLNITSKLKGLVNNNINLNLLIDRYIIEMERGD